MYGLTKNEDTNTFIFDELTLSGILIQHKEMCSFESDEATMKLGVS
jgi:hypothetical protein